MKEQDLFTDISLVLCKGAFCWGVELARKIFENLPEELSASKFLDYQNYLRSIYLHLKKNDAKINLATMSKLLGFSATNILSQYINGSRKLTFKAAKTIVANLGLKGDQRKYFLTLVEYNITSDVKEAERLFDKLYDLKAKIVMGDDITDQLAYFSKWYIPIIGEMARLDNFSPNPEWISKKLGPSVSIKEVIDALVTLEKLEILERQPVSNALTRTEKSFSTAAEVRGFVVKSFHKQMLEQSSNALYKTKSKSRNLNTLTLCCSKQEIKEINSKIQKLMHESLDVEGKAKEKSNIYQLNIQLFPLTDIDIKEVKK